MQNLCKNALSYLSTGINVTLECNGSSRTLWWHSLKMHFLNILKTRVCICKECHRSVLELPTSHCSCNIPPLEHFKAESIIWRTKLLYLTSALGCISLLNAASQSKTNRLVYRAAVRDCLRLLPQNSCISEWWTTRSSQLCRIRGYNWLKICKTVSYTGFAGIIGYK